MKSQTLYPRLVALLLSITLPASCKKEPQLSGEKKEIYEVINFCLSNEKIMGETKIVSDELSPYMPVPNDPVETATGSGFTHEDIDFISRQAADKSPLTLNPEKIIAGINLIPCDDLNALFEKYHNNQGSEQYWEKVEEKYGTGYVALSKPFFTKDYKCALICVQYSCGPLCGHGALYVLRKEKGKWAVEEVTSQWIS